jgi:Tol biopolymer transport system component
MPDLRLRCVTWALIALAGLVRPGGCQEPALLLYRGQAAGLPELWVVSGPGDGAEARRLLAPGIAAVDPAASAGGLVAFMRPGRDGRQAVWIARADGRGLRRVSPVGVDERMPSFSPDGRRLALVRDDGRGGTSIRVVNLDGTGGRNLTAQRGRATRYSPAWSPDGRRIAYASNLDGRFRIWVMREDGTGATPVSARGAGDLSPTWSPDGSRIAFVRQFADGASDLMVLDLATGAESRLMLPGTESGPAWAPDGLRIAFATDRHGNLDLYTVAPDGSALTRLTTHDADEAAPAWMPAPPRRVARSR